MDIEARDRNPTEDETDTDEELMETLEAGHERTRDDEADLSVSTVYEVIGNRRRRYAIRFLRDAGEAAPIGTVATYVAARENGCSVDEVTRRQRKRVYTALQQSHLPVMEDVGIAVYDADSGMVAPTESLAEVDDYAKMVRGSRSASRSVNRNVFRASAAVLVILWGLWLASAVSDLGLVTGVFLVVSIGTVARRHRSPRGRRGRG